MTDFGDNDQNASEERAELLATIRADHADMKAWFNGPSRSAALTKAAHGPYPIFARDVLGWDGWRETRRAYLKFVETGDVPAAAPNEEPEGGTATTAEAAAIGEPGNEVKRTRKRRSRWATGGGGDATSAATGTEEAVGGPDENQPPTTKRRSRWARGRDETPRPVPEAFSAPLAPAPAVPTSSADDAVAAALGALPGLAPPGGSSSSNGLLDLLPGMPGSDLPPERRIEFTALQSRLRLANERLDDLEAASAKIDALPRDHPDRSPSPPPVYGPDGKRRNTRAVRWRERYTNERLECLEKMMDLNPALRGSAAVAGVVRRRRTRKIWIPVEEHPTYNFIGEFFGRYVSSIAVVVVDVMNG